MRKIISLLVALWSGQVIALCERQNENRITCFSDNHDVSINFWSDGDIAIVKPDINSSNLVINVTFTTQGGAIIGYPVSAIVNKRQGLLMRKQHRLIKTLLSSQLFVVSFQGENYSWMVE